MRLAAIDIGTNSCRLLIAEVSGPRLKVLERAVNTTRIGAGVSSGGCISAPAIQRTLECLQSFQATMHRYKVRSFRIVGTSALREAQNRGEFLERVQNECGLQVEVISGEQEACLSYRGVCRGLGLTGVLPVVVDLGGGSTELVWPGDPPEVLSFPVGAVRAAEMDLDSGQIAAVLEPLREKPAVGRNMPLVFVGGTATSVVAIKLSLAEYRSELVHGQKLIKEDIEAIYRRLKGMNLEDRRRIPGLQEKRADIIVPGISIMLVIMDILGCAEVAVSESDLLDAIIWQLADEQRG